MTYKMLSELSTKSKGEYGIGASSCSFNPDFPQYIRITDITDDGRYYPQPAVSINPKEYPNYCDYYLQENDIVFARTGASTGRNYFYNKKDGNLVFAGFLIKFSINPKAINPRYIKYYCQTKQYRDWVAATTTGSTRGNLNAQLYGNLPIPIKSSFEQQHIVDVLGTLDEQIENNLKTISGLENLLTIEYQNLIAKDVENVSLSEYIELYTGKLDANAAEENGMYPFFTCGLTPERINTYAFDCEAIIIAGNGNFNVKYYNGKFNAYQRTYVITSNKYFGIIFQHYKGKIQEWTSSARGSVIKFLTKSMLVDDTFKISKYNERNEKYAKLSSDIQEKIKHLLDTNAKLNELKQLYLQKFFG